MLKRSDFHHYQEVALDWALTHPKCGLLLEMGLGKSCIMLTAIDLLLLTDINKVLIIAPLRVAQSVWAQEAKKWEHLKHLTFSHVLGDAVQRANALRKQADIHIINRENVPWLQAHYLTAWPFDMVIVDESSSFKDGQSKRFRALKMQLGKIKRLIILTGTPIGNGLMDLWSQIYLLDQGERLYPTVTEYRMRYFHNPEYRYVPLTGADEVIHEKIKDLVISMKNVDYLDLPEKIEVSVIVKFDKVMQKKYDDFEEACVMAISEDKEITAFNSGALSTKLLQFASGEMYDSERKVHLIHDLKMEALDEILGSAGGKPVLIIYEFQHTLDRIQKKYKAQMIRSDTDVIAWNRGEIPIAVGHPKSMGHGLNLQEGDTFMVFFDHTWSLELHDQTIARLLRQGRKEKVYIYKIIAENTMDQEVIKSQQRKAKGQDSLMQAVKAVIQKYKSVVLS